MGKLQVQNLVPPTPHPSAMSQCVCQFSLHNETYSNHLSWHRENLRSNRDSTGNSAKKSIDREEMNILLLVLYSGLTGYDGLSVYDVI